MSIGCIGPDAQSEQNRERDLKTGWIQTEIQLGWLESGLLQSGLDSIGIGFNRGWLHSGGAVLEHLFELVLSYTLLPTVRQVRVR
jgi:hypothetical protein